MDTLAQRVIGDIAFLMRPAKNVVLTDGEEIHDLMPEVLFELNQINETLDGLIVDAGNVTEPIITGEVHSPEAETILREADTLAEQRSNLDSQSYSLQPSTRCLPSSTESNSTATSAFPLPRETLKERNSSTQSRDLTVSGLEVSQT